MAFQICAWKSCLYRTCKKNVFSSKYIRKVISEQNEFDSLWQEIKGALIADTVDFVSDTAFCQLLPAFSRVSDRLGGQVSEQKDAGASDKIKMRKKSFGQNCRNSKWRNINSYTSQVMRKPIYSICDQHRCRSACTSVQSHQDLYCSLPR